MKKNLRKHYLIVFLLVPFFSLLFRPVNAHGQPFKQMWRYNTKHTGISPYKGIGPTEDTDPKIEWEYTESGLSLIGAPAIAGDGTIYVGSSNKGLYAIHPDGSLKWTFPGHFGHSCPAIATNGTIYIGSGDNKLYAIAPDDGSLLWEYSISNPSWSSPAIGLDGTIYIGSANGILYAINPGPNPSQRVKWTYNAKAWISTSPAIAADGDTIYFGAYNYRIYALDIQGNLLWKYQTEKSILSSPAIAADGTIYVGSDDGRLYAFDPNAQNPEDRVKWSWETGNKVSSSPAIAADGTIYVGSDDGRLYAFDPNAQNPEDRVKWSCQIGNFFHSSPIIDTEGTIFTHTQGNIISSFSSLGSLLWQTPAQGTNNVEVEIALDSFGNLYAVGNSKLTKWSLGNADLEITKTDNPDPATIKQNITYILVAANNGPDEAKNVTVTDTLPNSTDFVSVSSSQGSCSHTTGLVTCNLGNMSNGTQTTITITITPRNKETITNQANVSSNTSDSYLNNNHIEEKTSVEEINPCNADINVNGRVDPLDFVLLVKHWNSTNQQADINNSGLVDIEDLKLLILYWRLKCTY